MYFSTFWMCMLSFGLLFQDGIITYHVLWQRCVRDSPSVSYSFMGFRNRGMFGLQNEHSFIWRLGVMLQPSQTKKLGKSKLEPTLCYFPSVPISVFKSFHKCILEQIHLFAGLCKYSQTIRGPCSVSH